MIPYSLRLSRWLLLGCCLFVSELLQAQNAPQKLRFEYGDIRLGTGVTQPRLSWQLANTHPGVRQTAYQILVASSPEKLAQNEADLWDSGKVKTSQSVYVDYQGKSLESRQRYFWKVQTWDEKGTASGWSSADWWEMGLLDKKEWKADWIGMAGIIGEPPRSTQARKDFSVKNNLVKARIYATGLGDYVLKINNQKVGDQLLAPGWTDYLKKVYYQTYDVTSLLKSGENQLDAFLGNGWWSGGLGWGGGFHRYSQGPLRLLCQLELTYADGSTEVIASNKDWKIRLSPVIYDAMYHGEHYDARLEAKGTDADGWVTPVVLNDAKNQTTLFGPNKDPNVGEKADIFDMKKMEVVAQEAPPIRVTETKKAVTVTEPKPGHFVFDFGQNMAGIVHLSIPKATYSQEVVLHFAELLHEDGTVAQENLRSAKSTDRYICKSNGEAEEWEPMFLYHGFRYVEVVGFPGKPTVENVVAKVIHTDFQPIGEFSASEEILNKIYSNAKWTLKSNALSIPTDCPQRDERLGWMGDAQIFVASSCYLMDINSFWAKYARDIADSQHPSGYVYDVNPKMVVGGPSKPAWGDATLIVPWTTYEFFGDKRILEKNYESMKAWVEYMNTHTSTKKAGIYYFSDPDEKWFGYGDWVPVVASPGKPIGGAYQIYSNTLLAKAAHVLGKTKEAETYAALAKQYTTKYNELYFKDNNYEGKTQAANLMPLSFGIVPEKLKPVIAKNVADDVKAHQDHLTTGFIASQQILPRLTDYGYNDLAYKVATQKTYPSWGYMAENGATTMWELWNSDKERPEGMNSRNHFAYGSVIEWYFRYLAGVEPIEPGFKTFRIAPKPPKGLNRVNFSYQSLYGPIVSNWERKDGKLILNVTIPPNTVADLELPLQAGQSASLEGKKLKKGVSKLQPGSYQILIQ
ncbi:family 78 glycoside hydrolase catalytic domain [Siphonobacter sp. SORGH_AS_0500]|uniref:family 78 glycoside hydrolase catalytic domain n=1 Tax=Siphonobacter sp. SORGH_AS_0500 TaxID=1864824 RepID=UPI0028624775|nr:family 78 glycoside hydrolase catalytic domain [Siphonobacter sp. SORGH_AS_0500]MDR6194202.1 alpha-L-rhamnosidase [Siphonobacter sp. SORGH_AS_0500]